MFKHLEISDWQQLDHVSLDLSAQVTIITGTNGSGKTTLVSLLAKHFGFQFQSYATPVVSEAGDVSYTAGLWGQIKGFFVPFKERAILNSIGSIKYSNGSESTLISPQTPQAGYHIGIQNQKPVPGFFLPSNRPTLIYQKTSKIATGQKTRKQAFSEMNQKFAASQAGQGLFIGPEIKTTLLQWLVDGSGIYRNGLWIRPRHAESEENYAGFEDVLRRFLPPSLQFERLEFRADELVFVCQNGKEQFILETASGGVTTLISLAWLLYNFSSQSKEFTLIIDEIENHLHPLLQREILRTIRDVFPLAKIIATTHSPLVVNSVKDARVYALKPNERNRIVSIELPIRDKTATANRILDEILGVSAPYPAWAEEEIDAVLLNFKSKPFNDENAKLLMLELKKRGLGDLVNAALGKWLDDQDH